MLNTDTDTVANALNHEGIENNARAMGYNRTHEL